MKKAAIIIIPLLLIAIVTIAFISDKAKEHKEKNRIYLNPNSMNEIKLPAPAHKGTMSVEEALLIRRSIRSFTNETLSIKDASQMLWATYGVSLVTRSGWEFKTAPSAGATYPLEIYLLAGNVEQLQAGLYHYNPSKHSLKKLISGDLRNQMMNAALGQKMLEEAPATIIFTAVFERTTSRYGNRGRERYVCMDLGHAAQNTYLQATALNLGTCAIGAFQDEKLHQLFKFPVNEEVLYLMPIGHPK